MIKNLVFKKDTNSRNKNTSLSYYDRCTVKQKFASDSKMMTSLGTKTHLKNTKHWVLITVLLHHHTTSKELKRKKH